MYNKILIKSCCTFASVVGDVATEFKWYDLRNPRVSFRHVDTESIRVDETFVDIHAEDDNDNDNDTNDFVQPPSTRPGLGTNMDLLLDDDNDWASQGFEHLNRRLPRSQQPRLTNPNQLSRGSCFF